MKRFIRIRNNKRDLKAVEKNLKVTEKLFINNTQKLIYNFK